MLIHNIKTFVVRVGTIIFVLNLVVWILSHISLTAGFVLDGKGSIMFTFANIFAPIFYPLGFGNWKAVTALLSGLVAKESVISTLGTLGGAGVVAEGGYPIASSIAFCVFTLLYIPCIATIGALLKEVGVKWTVFGVILQLLCAYAFALLIRLIMIVASLSIGVVVSAIIVSLMIIISIIMLRKIIKNKKLDCINCSICKKNCAKKE